MNYFKDKVAIVTGGASGIGRSLCEALAQRKAKAVIVADKNGDKAMEVASALFANGYKAYARQIDVSKAKDINNLIDDTVALYGKLDFMFNNAGIAIFGETKNMTPALWQKILAINLQGTINGTSKAYDVMIKQGFGHIVNTASTAGLVPIPMNVAYSTTKYAIVGLSTSLRTEAKTLGIKISVVCPGFIQTGIYEAGTMITTFKDKNTIVDQMPKMLDANKCAQIILTGVAANKAIITVTALARFLWLAYRYCPAFYNLLWRKPLKNFYSLKEISGE